MQIWKHGTWRNLPKTGQCEGAGDFWEVDLTQDFNKFIHRKNNKCWHLDFYEERMGHIMGGEKYRFL